MQYAFALLLLFQSLNNLVDGVQRNFARMKDYSSDFTQFSKDVLNRRQEAAGHVYLMRPGKARWEYTHPEEQYWVSDGKNVYFYVPLDKQVTKDSVKDVFDDRMPLMFLLGRSNLRGEFTQFEEPATKPVVAGARVVRMTPRRKTDLKELIMEVDPANFQIRRLVLERNDGARNEFIFSNIRTNTGLKSAQFEFKIPPGVQVIEGPGR